MLKEGDFIEYRGKPLLILNAQWAKISFYVVLEKTSNYHSIYRDYPYTARGMPLQEHDVVLINGNQLKVDFMEALLRGRIFRIGFK